MPKILTPVNFGAFALAHRVATVISPSVSECRPMSAQGPIGPGGLFIYPFSPLTVPQRTTDSAVDDLAAWQTYNDTIRLAGGTIIARGTPDELAMPPLPEKGVLRPGSSHNWGTLAREADFDGAELDATAYLLSRSTEPLLDSVQDLIAVWGADRVGLHLAPLEWMTRSEDFQSAVFYSQVIGALVDLDIAYIHVAGACTPEGAELSSSPLGRHLRRAFPGVLIASGGYPLTSAIAAVESRWADAVAFTRTIGNSASLLVEIHDAALLP
jgi:hypothetical protein